MITDQLAREIEDCVDQLDVVDIRDLLYSSGIEMVIRTGLDFSPAETVVSDQEDVEVTFDPDKFRAKLKEMLLR